MPTLLPTTLGKFCREIACGLSPLPVLLDEWGLSQDDYARIKESDGYKKEMVTIVAEMEAMGPDAGYIYRMKDLSEEFLTDIVKIMRDETTGAGTKVEIIKFVADLARLKERPPTAAEAKNLSLPRGPTVVFQFGAGLPVQSMQVLGETLDVEPTPQPAPAPTPPLATHHLRGFNLELADD